VVSSGKSAIRVGLLGYGIGGRNFHAPFIAASPDLDLTAVVTSNPERQAQLRAEHPEAAVLPDAEQLWKRADDLDLVVVTTPNSQHAPLTLAAIERELPVVVDKPLAPSAAEGSHLVAEARRRGVPLSVFQNRRWDGDLRTVRRLLASGELGTVHRFESRFEMWRPTPRPGWREHGAPDEAGGILFDLGSHLIDQAMYLFGPVTTVYSEIDRRRGGVEVDDDAFVALTHASGLRSHLWMSRLSAQVGPRLRVLGSEAAYVKYGLDGQEAALKAGERPDRADWGEEPPNRWGRLGVEDDLRPVRTERGAYQEFYAGMVAALRDGAPVPVDPEDAVNVLRVIELARNGGGSIASGGVNAS
jgi:predicted dehydrogenase